MRRLIVPFATLGTVAAFVIAAANIAHVAESSFSQIERGRYLARAGDCVACHTVRGEKPYAGGRAIETPFGTIYSANLTPDRETGIGAWSDEDFYRALHHGMRPNGERLYPAFPYQYFTKMPREDVQAVRAYLKTLEPVRNDPPPPDLYWPLNYRFGMRGWNWLFFEPGVFKPNPEKSEKWNRGAYLVEGPGHCGACHTPKNSLGAPKESRPLQGGLIQSWFAPNITNDPRVGLGNWSIEDVVEFLKTGRNRFSGATGLMAEAVEHSTSKLTVYDLEAIAVYLKDRPQGEQEAADAPDSSQMSAGEAIYADSCAGCHRQSGAGEERMFPDLRGNPTVQQRDPTTIIRIILLGARTAVTDERPTPSSMPSFDWKLSDRQIAAVATYVRNTWGNSAPPVTPGQVGDLRQSLLTTLRGKPGEKK